MFLCSLIEELCTKEEDDKTGCNFNFGHECIIWYKGNNVIIDEIRIYFNLETIKLTYFERIILC